MQKQKFRITQTLLSSWIWATKSDAGFEDFLKALNRQKKTPTKQMLDGSHFEEMVNAALDGQAPGKDHKWYEQVMACRDILQGSQKQVVLFRDVKVNGVPFLLHGVLDFLRAGVIYDTKFSHTYHVNKYIDSPQAPMYFALVPEAYRFQYVICDGTYVYRETYAPDMFVPIENTITNFMNFLDRFDLISLYTEKWSVK